jgi:hypothetical protein
MQGDGRPDQIAHGCPVSAERRITDYECYVHGATFLGAPLIAIERFALRGATLRLQTEPAQLLRAFGLCCRCENGHSGGVAASAFGGIYISRYER